MTDAEKIAKLLALVKHLRKFVGMFMQKEIDEVLEELVEPIVDSNITHH